jgi:streptogramin lyase
MATDDRTLQNYIQAILRLQQERARLTDDELRQIALETGMSEEDLAHAQKRASDHLERGRGFLRYENWGAAVDELEQAVVLMPANPGALTLLADAYWRRNSGSADLERARTFASRALELDPRHDDALRIVTAIDLGEPPPTPKTAAVRASSGRRFVSAGVAALLVLGGAIASIVMTREPDDVPVVTTQPSVPSPVPVAEAPAPPTPPTPVEPPRGFAALAQTIGSEGIGPGLMTDARTIAVAPDGRVFVGEYSDGRIQVFDAGGRFLTMWSIGKNRYLKSMSIDREGTVYLVYGGQIHRFDAEGKELGTLRYAGGPGFEHASVTADGGIVATWNGHYKGGLLINPQSRDAIVRFDRKGKVVRTLKTAVSAQTENFETDVDIAEDGLGTIYALSSSSGSILKFNSSGKFLDSFGGRGDERGSFGRPDAIAVDGQGRILVLEGRAIKRYDASGRYVDELQLDKSGSDFALADDGAIVTVARTVVQRYR